MAVTIYNEEGNSRGFNWVTKTNINNSQFQYLLKVDEKNISSLDWSNAITVDGVSYDYYDNYRAWRAEVLDLEYGETYYYRVGSINNDSFSKIGSLYINDGLESLEFIHVSDMQGTTKSHYDMWLKTINVMSSNFKNIDVMLLSGDLADSMGLQSKANNEMGWLLNGANNYLKDLVLTPAAGNHDTANNIFYAHFNVNLSNDQDYKWGMYYNYKIGDTEVIVLNTNDDLNNNFRLNSKQVNWFGEVLKNSTAKWKIVVIHEALISTGKHMNDRSSRYIREDLMPLISEYHVDLVLSGHDHVYSRSNPYLWDNEEGTMSNQGIEMTLINDNNHLKNYYNTPGTFYVTQNATTGVEGKRREPSKQTSEPEWFDLATSTINDKYMSYQPDAPTFGHLEIKNNKLTYSSYYVNNHDELVLFDTFDVIKDVDSNPKVNYLNELIFKAFLQADSDVIAEIDEQLTLLTAVEKDDVMLLTDYYQLRADYQSKISAIRVVNKIDKLLLTADIDTSDIKEARTLYSVLSDEAKYYVTNYFILVKLEIEVGMYRRQVSD